MRAAHPVVAHFRYLMRESFPREAARPRLEAYGDDDFGLVIKVTGLNEDCFNPAVLAGAEGGPHPVFTSHGEQTWALIRDHGQRALAYVQGAIRASQANLLVAVILDPGAVEEAAIPFRARRAA